MSLGIAWQQRGRSRRFFTGGLLLAIALLLLSGCVDIEVSSEYRADGSASHAVQIQIDHVPADREESEDMIGILGDLEQRSIDAGLDFERREEGGVTTVVISGSTGVGLEAGAALNSLINATGLNAAPGIAAPFRGTFRREAGAIGGSSYILDLSVDGDLLFESVVIERLNESEQDRRELVIMHYIATFPGDVTRTEGEIIDDRTVRWEVPFDGVTDLSVTARTGGAGSAALFIIVGVSAALVIMAIAVGLGIYFSRRKRLMTTLGGPVHRLPGQQTVTHEGIWVARKISAITHRITGTRADRPADE